MRLFGRPSVLLDGLFVTPSVAQKMLNSRGVHLSPRQILNRHKASTLNDRSKDMPMKRSGAEAAKIIRQRKKQEMIQLIADMDAAKLKIKGRDSD